MMLKRIMKYDKINNYQLSNNKFLFFDIFARNSEVILIVPIAQFNQIKDMDLYYNENKLIVKYCMNTQWIVVVKYDIHVNISNHTDCAMIDIYIIFNNIIKNYKLEYLEMLKPKYLLTQSTLFKNDSYLINLFTNYYKKRGVQHFYLYNNGKPYNVVDDMVTMIEWNYEYYYNSHRGWGHAQAGQLNHSLYKYGKLTTQYMLYNDLDEYLDTSNLKMLVQEYQSIDTFMFCNIWADTIEEPENMEEYYNKLSHLDKLPDEFYINQYIDLPTKHSKCIHKTSSIYLIQSVHYGEYYYNTNNIYNDSLVMYHFFRWVYPHIDHSVRERADVGFNKKIYKNI